MNGGIDENIAKGKKEMEQALEYLGSELNKVRTGKAAPAMVSSLMVDYYGTPTPMNQVANVGTSDSKTITIQPWEKSMLGPIERAIFEANLGLTPMNDGELVRISIPPLTEERRKDLVKHIKTLGEDAKVSIRNTRQKLMDIVKREVKDGFPEDAGKRKEAEIQQLVKVYSAKVDEVIDAKETDVMTI